MAIPKYIKEIRRFIGNTMILAPSVTAFVVSKEDEILVVKSRESSAWTLPGGMVEPGETPVDALMRETFEETGFWVRPTSVLAVLGGPNGFQRKYSNGDLVEFVDTLFLCVVQSHEKITLDPEIVECKFALVTSLNDWSYPLPVACLIDAAKSGRTIFGRKDEPVCAGE